MSVQTVCSSILAVIAAILALMPNGAGLSAQESSRRTSPKSGVATNQTTKTIHSAVDERDILSRRNHEAVALYAVNPDVNEKPNVARTAPTQPANSILPVAYTADQVPVPSLADPEDFRIPPTRDSNFHNRSYQFRSDDIYGDGQRSQPTGSYSSLPVRNAVTLHPVATGVNAGRVFLPQQGRINMDQQNIVSTGDEDSLLNRLPVSNLHQGIAGNALSQAVVKHTVGDPYLAQRSYDGIPLRSVTSTVKTWRSPNMKHRPLYFEEANLERYGHAHPRLQPLISGAHFFSSVALLPYNSSVTPANTCKYSIGHDRPGDCVAPVREQHPFNARAALRQAAIVVGGIAGL